MRPIRLIGLLVAAWILGGVTPPAEGRGAVTIKFTTTPVPAPNNTYTPSNAVAVWVQGPGGAFVKTVGQWVQIRQPYLVAWQQAAGTADVDAVSGASRTAHTGQLTAIWNLRDRAGNVVPDGTYTIRLELAEGNSTTAAQNNQGTVTFVKSATPQLQTNLTNGGFTGVELDFSPTAVRCADGVADSPEEKCDRGIAAGAPGACPTVCPAADACMPVSLQGDAMLCTAECVPGAPITACTNGDGCCAAGCTEDNDDDCGAGEGPPTTTGGCETGGGAGGALAFAALGLALLVSRSTRRRGA